MRESLIRKYNILTKLFILSSITILATGNFYDERLHFLGLNLSVVFTILYFVLLYINLNRIKEIKIYSINILQYSIYFYMIISSLILWIIFDIHEYNDIRYESYATTKYLTILFFILPFCFLINHLFKKSDITFLIILLFAISCLLFIVSIFYIDVFLTGRVGILGGGPIILSRWLCFGSIIILFLPQKIRFRIFFSILFLAMALLTGSRGPIVSIFFVSLVYLLINYKNFFRKFIIIFSFLIIIVITNFHFLQDITPLIRIFNHLTIDSFMQGERLILYKDSLEMLIEYPFGVGCGNFSAFSETKLFFSKMKAYPHNVFLEVFNEYGFICGFLFLIYIVFSLYKGYKNVLINKLEYSKLFFYLAIYLLSNSLFSGDLVDARILLLILPFLTKEY